MHHYAFNVGDYRKDTAHLSLLEHGIYRMLLDSYYVNEGPFEADDAKLMRTHCVRTADEQQAYRNVISDFFVLEDGHYRHRGCDKVLASIYEKSDKARRSAEARWARKIKPSSMVECEKDANALRAQSERNANGMLPNTHNPIPKEDNSDELSKRKAPKRTKLDFTVWPQMPDQQTLDDWIAMRKRIKADVSQTVINTFAPQFRKAVDAGRSVNECLQECVARNWRGFKFQWLVNQEQGNANSNQNPRPTRLSATDAAFQEYFAGAGEPPGDCFDAEYVEVDASAEPDGR